MTMTTIPPNIPRWAFEQSMEKWWALFGGCPGLTEFLRVRLISGIDFTFFHISNKITAQISEYSIVHGKRNGEAFCTKLPIMFVRWQSSYFCDVPTIDRFNRWWSTTVAFVVELWAATKSWCVRCPFAASWCEWSKCQISCFVSSTSVYNHSQRFVATICMRPKRAKTLWRAMSSSVVFKTEIVSYL